MALRSVRVAIRSRLLALPSERGSVLIEAMVGAIVLAIATFAILDGLDGAQATGAKNKARSEQSSLAQQDIERMRAIPVSGLSNLRQTRTVNVAGVDYTVVSRTDWVHDATGEVSCSSDTTQATYLKLSSTVSSQANVDRPVKETGLLTPSLGQLSATAGTATVRLTDREGRPHVGVAVNLSGPVGYSDRTNELGCVVFGYIPAGNYTASVPGMVERPSDGTASEPLPVYVGQSSLGQLEVERPASLQATFVPPIGQTFPVSPQQDTITVKNAGLPGSQKTFTRPGGAAGSVEADGLFPFLDGVAVYAGQCTANDPSSYLGQTDYFQNAEERGFTPLDPGDVLRSVQVEMPTLRVVVRRTDTTTGFGRAEVTLTGLDGCTGVFSQTSSLPAAETPHTFDFAVPFGRYAVCASTRTGGAGTIRRIDVPDKDLTRAPSTPDEQIEVTTGGTTGSCP